MHFLRLIITLLQFLFMSSVTVTGTNDRSFGLKMKRELAVDCHARPQATDTPIL